MADPMHNDAVKRLYDALASRDAVDAISSIESARDGGIPQDALLDEVFAPALSMLGAAWASGALDEYAFAEAAVAAEQASSFVIPPQVAGDTGVTVLVGAIEGDRHATAKNIAAGALKQAGYRVIDLGVDARPATFLERAEESGAAIALVSAQLVSAADEVARVREHFTAAGRELALFVTGGPFEADESLARKVGANGVTRGAESAVRFVGMAAERLGGGR